jgi:hypothetical protein
MPTLSAAQLEAMRSTQVSHLPDLVTITRQNRAPDGKGGFKKAAPTVVAADVACAIAPLQQMVAGGQADRGLEIEKWVVTFEWATDVQDGDVLEWTAENIQLQVEDAKVSKSNGTAVRCTAELVKGVKR